MPLSQKLRRISTLAVAMGMALPMIFSAPVPARAGSAPVCAGSDLLEALPAAERAAIQAEASAQPYAHGTRFVARKGDATVYLVGTYHFDDPRHAETRAAIAPHLREAATLLVEAGPEEEKRLSDALSTQPELIVDPEGDLSSQLTPQEWTQLREAMSARGVPALMVAKMRPWYVSMMLGISPCMLSQVRGGETAGGLDRQLVAMARENEVSIAALEPWDTVFRMFSGLEAEARLDMIRASLPAAGEADDFAVTLANAYFRGDVWEIWALNGYLARRDSDLPPARIEQMLDMAQDRLMDERNRAWIGPITQAATQAAQEGKPVVAAFGALHLPGKAGVLALLEAQGWRISPLEAG